MNLSPLQLRKVRLMRKRLQQHTGLEGSYEEPHCKTEVPREVAESAESDDTWSEARQDTFAEVENDAFGGFDDADDETANMRGKGRKPSRGGNNNYSVEMELAAETAWGHVPKQASLAKEEVQSAWMREQLELKEQLVLDDELDFTFSPDDPSATTLKYIAGLDLSFVKGTDHAVASLVVLKYPSLMVEYEGFSHCVCRNPYIPGFLAYREIPGLLQAVADLKKKRPDLRPQLWMLDGNGTIHHRGFGLACHFGVVTGYPSLGVAKSLLQVDGMSKDQIQRQVEDLPPGESVELWGNSGRVWGHALVTKKDDPVFVSPGHKISLSTALAVTKEIWGAEEMRKRLPVPTRLADALSRSYIKKAEAARGRRR